ncbi:MAG: LacI family DNA-binding transcriptional regulator [Betaproteobacteria bacterium]
MITIKDIARVVGVAPSTVARALADHPHVHEDTKARVREAAAQLGYVAHSPARLMRGGTSSLIGLLVPDVRNDFYSTAAQAISEGCATAGFQVVLGLTSDSAARELGHVHGLVSARAAGVILVPTARPAKATLVLLERLPHVQFIRRNRSIHAPWFGIDDAASTRLAAQHLLGLGHRQIAYIGGDRRLSTGSERFEAFEKALAAHGLRAQPEYCAHGPGGVAFSATATRQILAQTPRPTALMLAGSHLTVDALEAVRALRIAVPDELSIVGFNDSAALGWWGAGVTSVGLPVFDIAGACASGLLGKFRQQRNAGDDIPRPPSEAMFAPFLVERGSTARLAPRHTRKSA